MAVTSVTEHPESGKGDRDSEERRYVRMQIVRTDSRNDGASVVLANASVIKYGTIYAFRNEIDVGAICLRLACDPYEGGLVPGGRLFLVTAEYSTKFTQQEKEQEEQNPFSVPPRVMPGGSQEHRRIIDKDKDGAAFVNTLGDRFLDPPEIEDYYRRLVVVNNEAFLDEDKYEQYIGSVNNATWRGASARKWLMTNISHSEARYQAGLRYYEVTYEMLKNRDTWDVSVVNVGSRFKNGAAKIVNCRDENSLDTGVVRLSSSSTMLADTSTNFYVTKRCRPETTWSSLGIEGAS